MAKLTKEQKEKIIKLKNSGMKPQEIADKFKVTKQTYYNVVRDFKKKKSDSSDDGSDSGSSVSSKASSKSSVPIKKTVISKTVDSDTEASDDTASSVSTTKKIVDNQPPKAKDNIHDARLDPMNMKSFIAKNNETEKKHLTLPKSLLNKASKDIDELMGNKKPTQRGRKKANDNEPEELPEDKKLLITKIRQYIFSFEDNENVQQYVGKNKDAFLLRLEKKSVKDLENILEHIKFYVRNVNMSDQFIITSLGALLLIFEKVGSFIGFELEGLSKEIMTELENDDTELKRAVVEVAIEMNTQRYFNSPKIDLMMIVGKKMIIQHESNKLNKQANIQLNIPVNKENKKSVEFQLRTSYDEDLKTKYADL